METGEQYGLRWPGSYMPVSDHCAYSDERAARNAADVMATQENHAVEVVKWTGIVYDLLDTIHPGKPWCMR